MTGPTVDLGVRSGQCEDRERLPLRGVLPTTAFPMAVPFNATEVREIRYRLWTFRCNVSATRAAYSDHLGGDVSECQCVCCRNFAAARTQVYPEEVSSFLLSAGIDQPSEAEVYWIGPVAGGLHQYGGWLHFAGELADGPRMNGYPSGVWLQEVTPTFSIGFRAARQLAFATWGEHRLIQVEFQVVLPWVLKEPYFEGGSESH